MTQIEHSAEKYEPEEVNVISALGETRVMTVIQIDSEFKAMIPPLKAEEREQLEKNLLADGCRDPLVVWNGILLDGHNRYEICQKHGIEFKTVEADIKDRQEALVWIIRNQLGRRNLEKYVRVELALKLEAVIAAKAKEKQKEHGGTAPGKAKTVVQNSAPVLPEERKTRSQLAKIANVSHDTIAKAKVIAAKAPESVKAKLRSGETSINAEYEKIRKQERTAQIQAERAKLAEAGNAIKKSDRFAIYHADIAKWQAPRQYDFIITDPPYPKEYLPLWEVLAERSLEWLKDGGLLIAMSGQSYLDQVYAILSRHLHYYWTAAYLTPGQPTPLRQVNVNTTWKPLLIFSKGKYSGKIFGDVFKSDRNEKDLHEWGQSESGMFDIVSKICLPGQYILDPFCGSGTTGIAALRHGCLFDGIDIAEENVNISKGRLNDATTGK